jgi:all-trans-retinol dehydrogenase (NAD+)
MFSGVKAPIVMPMLTPESITDKILHGVENNAAFVKEPFIVKAIDLLQASRRSRCSIGPRRCSA